MAAAGNAGNSNRLYPAAESIQSVSNIVGVGASTRYDKLADFSTMAEGRSGNERWVEAVAPGVDIVSAIPGGRYGMWSGTSMSAPIVAGIAALVAQQNPNFTPEQVLNQITETGGVQWDCRNSSPRPYIFKTTRVDALCPLNSAACVFPPTPACQAQ